jgi:hypothetical protein
MGVVQDVVHVAGILCDRMVFNMSEEEWDDVIRVHPSDADPHPLHARGWSVELLQARFKTTLEEGYNLYRV